MQLNWKVRFKNKLFLTEFISLIISFIYNILAMLEIAPSVTQNAIMQVANSVLMVLAMLGIIVDPTTEGISDSNRAMGYEEPWEDK